MSNEEIQVEAQPEPIEPELEITLEDEPEVTPEPTPAVDWQKEALKYKAIAQRYAKKVQGGTPEPKQVLPKADEDIREQVKKLSLAETKRQFGYQHGLSPEETDYIFKMSPQPSKEVLDDPFVKAGLSGLRSKRKVEDNTPSVSRSKFREVMQKADATEAEKEKAWQADVEAKLNKRRT